MDWRHNAVCREEDPELFFPIGNTGPALLQIEEAKAVCRRCPVMEQRRTVLQSGQDSGVWGGLSEDERRAMKRRAAGTGPVRPPPDTPPRNEPEPGGAYSEYASPAPEPQRAVPPMRIAT